MPGNCSSSKFADLSASFIRDRTELTCAHCRKVAARGYLLNEVVDVTICRECRSKSSEEGEPCQS